jgi:SH3 domain
MSAQLEEEVDLFEGDMVTILEKVDKNYYRGTSRGRTGIFPCAFVTLVDSSQASASAAPEKPKSKSAQMLDKYQPPLAMPPVLPSRLIIRKISFEY